MSPSQSSPNCCFIIALIWASFNSGTSFFLASSAALSFSSFLATISSAESPSNSLASNSLASFASGVSLSSPLLSPPFPAAVSATTLLPLLALKVTLVVLPTAATSFASNIKYKLSLVIDTTNVNV